MSTTDIDDIRVTGREKTERRAPDALLPWVRSPPATFRRAEG